MQSVYYFSPSRYVRPESSAAHFATGEYSHAPASPGQEGCSWSNTRLDPITIIFIDWGYADRADDSLEYHFGWTTPSNISRQWYLSHGWCDPDTHQKADGDGERYHIRIKKTYHSDDGGFRITSQSTPHWERVCPGGGHGVFGPPTYSFSGFTHGRQRIIDGLYFRDGHAFWGYQWWGNTDPRLPQCGVDWAANDGHVGFLYQHYSTHN